jgi:deferrochelatase/peroxidase EfeB
VDLAAWGALSRAEQERIVGRRKDNGAPLGGRHRYDGFDREDLPVGSHARVANTFNTILRRGYHTDTGLFFAAFMRDPRRQYVPLQRRLAAEDLLHRLTRHVGSAVFAIPPAAAPGGFVGAGACH